MATVFCRLRRSLGETDRDRLPFCSGYLIGRWTTPAESPPCSRVNDLYRERPAFPTGLPSQNARDAFQRAERCQSANRQRISGTIRLLLMLAIMSPLWKFLLVNGLGGFGIGLVAAIGYIMFFAEPALFSGQPLGTVLLVWAFGSSFAAGAIGTGLALLPQE